MGGAVNFFANSSPLEPTIVNSIFWQNTAAAEGNQIWASAGAGTLALELSHTRVQTGPPNIERVLGATVNTTSLLSQDPLFANASAPSGLDGVFGTADDGLNLVPNSPALDAGVNTPFELGGAVENVTTDLTGASRIQDNGNGATVNLGAYEVAEPARTIRVDADTAGGDGTSWSDAYASLQAALGVANSNDELWIAEGVYKPDNEGDSFTITGTKNGIALYGGFEGTESDRSAREPKQHRTILSGDLNGDDTDPDNDDIIEEASDIQGDDNAHHVLFLDGTTGGIISLSTRLDGLTVTAGQVDGSGREEDGGGLYCNGQGSGNDCSPTLDNVQFSGNEAAKGSGGALYNNGSNSGASSPVIPSATFTGNESKFTGGAIFNDGQDGTSSPTIRKSTFVGNKVRFSGGGAIYNNGSGGVSNPTIVGAAFIGNTVGSGKGGAIYNDGGGSGSESSPTIINAVFTGNRAESNGGGAVFNDGTSGTSSPTLINATFAGNESVAGRGGAIASEGGFGTSNPVIKNTILWGSRADSGGDEIQNTDASSTLAHTIIEGGVNGPGVGGNANSDNGGNLDRDPLFEYAPLPRGDDRTFATDDDGLHVTPGSPAIGAGDNTPFQAGNVAENVSTDITGASRLDGTVDIGAYEGGRDQERTIFVDPTASGAADGTSWADADTTLQDTASIASGPFSYATGNGEVRIAEGVYTPQKADTSFTLTGGRDGLEVFGGYPSGGGDRDPAAHRTVLSGDVGGDDNDPDGDGVNEDASGIQGANSQHFLFLDGTTSSGPITRATRINGVVVTAGQGSRGGGLYCQADASLAVVSPTKCSPTLTRMVFSGNVVTDDGGALYNNGLNGASAVRRSSAACLSATRRRTMGAPSSMRMEQIP